MLKRINYKVYAAENGGEALYVLNKIADRFEYPKDECQKAYNRNKKN